MGTRQGTPGLGPTWAAEVLAEGRQDGPQARALAFWVDFKGVSLRLHSASLCSSHHHPQHPLTTHTYTPARCCHLDSHTPAPPSHTHTQASVLPSGFTIHAHTSVLLSGFTPATHTHMHMPVCCAGREHQAEVTL